MRQMKLQSIEINVMEQYTPLEGAQRVELYIKKHYSIEETQREFCAKFKSRSAPAKNTMNKIYENLFDSILIRYWLPSNVEYLTSGARFFECRIFDIRSEAHRMSSSRHSTDD